MIQIEDEVADWPFLPFVLRLIGVESVGLARLSFPQEFNAKPVKLKRQKREPSTLTGILSTV